MVGNWSLDLVDVSGSGATILRYENGVRSQVKQLMEPRAIFYYIILRSTTSLRETKTTMTYHNATFLLYTNAHIRIGYISYVWHYELGIYIYPRKLLPFESITNFLSIFNGLQVKLLNQINDCRMLNSIECRVT